MMKRLHDKPSSFSANDLLTPKPPQFFESNGALIWLDQAAPADWKCSLALSEQSAAPPQSASIH